MRDAVVRQTFSRMRRQRSPPHKIKTNPIIVSSLLQNVWY
jgi:hypothetical protein